MKIYYRILSVNHNDGSISVRYYTDFLTETMLACEFDIDGEIVYTANGYPLKCQTDFNLSLYNRLSLSTEDLKKYIEDSAPIQWFTLIKEVQTNNTIISLENAESMKEIQNEFVYNSNNGLIFNINALDNAALLVEVQKVLETVKTKLETL